MQPSPLRVRASSAEMMPITDHMPVPMSTIDGADAHRRASLLAGHAHQAAERLHQRVVAGPVLERPAAPNAPMLQ